MHGSDAIIMGVFSRPFIPVGPRWTGRGSGDGKYGGIFQGVGKGPSASPFTPHHSTLILFNLLPLIMMIMMMIMTAVEVAEVSTCTQRKFGAPPLAAGRSWVGATRGGPTQAILESCV